MNNATMWVMQIWPRSSGSARQPALSLRASEYALAQTRAAARRNPQTGMTKPPRPSACHISKLIGMFCVIGLGAAANLASAQILSQPVARAVAYTEYYGNGGLYQTCAPQSSTGCNLVNSQGAASYKALAAFQADPAISPTYINPNVEAYTSLSGNNSLSYLSNSSASVYYEFEVLAPTNIGTAAFPISVDITASASATATSGVASGGMDITYASDPATVLWSLATAACVGVTTPYCSGGASNQAVAVKEPFTIDANTIYEIELSAGSEISAVPGFADAKVDPYIAIDPASLAQYPNAQILLSPGVQQASPVPLPASAWLLVSGLCGLGALGRRKYAAKQSAFGCTAAWFYPKLNFRNRP